MREPYADYIPLDARRAGWDAFEAARRDHADLPQIYGRAVHAAAPLILAAELERWADAWSVLRDEWRDIDGRTVRSSALGHAVQELNARVAELRTPAAVTPEPAGPQGSVDGVVPPGLAEVIDQAPSLADLRADNARLAAEQAVKDANVAQPRRWAHGAKDNPPRISPREAHGTGVGLRNKHGRTWHWRDGGWSLDGKRPAVVRTSGYDTSTKYAFWALVEQHGPLTEAPAVPPAEPGAGA